MQPSFLLEIDNVVDIYGHLLTSINTIWIIYVTVFLGMIGWAVTYAKQLSKSQKRLVAFISLIFSLVVSLYFYDAYADLDMIKNELVYRKISQNLMVVENGISGHLLSFDYFSRFDCVLSLIFFLYLLLVTIIWSNKFGKVIENGYQEVIVSSIPQKE